MKTLKTGEQVKVISGRYAGRVGEVEAERKGKIVVRLDADSTSTSRPSVAFKPEMISRVLVLFLALCATFAPMARGQAYSGVATEITGRPLPFAQVEVCAGWSDTLLQNPGQLCHGPVSPVLPLATVYSNVELTAILSNPFNADGNGRYVFFAASGSYTVSVASPGFLPYSFPVAVVTPTGVTTTGSPSAGNLAKFSGPSSITSGDLSGDVSTSGGTVATLATVATPGTNTKITYNAKGLVTGGAQAQFSDIGGSLPAADVPATTSNCAGVQSAQGLNAGLTPICATPPTFGASGSSHSVGYVPDPGSTAGTTRFLREDATWQTVSSGGGVSEATWSTSDPATPGTEALGIYSETILPSAHTLTRFTGYLAGVLASCSTTPQISFYDVTASTALATLTIATGTNFFDSGALSVSMPAGHTFGMDITRAGSSCTAGSNVTWTAVYQ